MPKSKLLSLLFAGAVLLALSGFASSTKLTGPFKVKLELSHMPQLNEQVALICSVTSNMDVDTAMVKFWIPDTLNVKVVKGQKIRYCSFQKNKTKEFKLTVSFQNEGIFILGVYARLFAPGGASISNSTQLIVKTYKDKKAVLLESMPWKLPKNVGFGPRRPGFRDSIEARAGSLIIKQLTSVGMASADKPTGPFTVKLEISHLPQLNEEVALICSVTSVIEVDSGLVSFWVRDASFRDTSLPDTSFRDTSIVKLVECREKHYCKFKKGETKEFEWTVSFTTEAIFVLTACADQFFPTVGAQGNSAHLNVKTYKDKKAVLLERIPWKLPDKALRHLRPGLRDSISAWAESLRIKQR